LEERVSGSAGWRRLGGFGAGGVVWAVEGGCGCDETRAMVGGLGAIREKWGVFAKNWRHFEPAVRRVLVFSVMWVTLREGLAINIRDGSQTTIWLSLPLFPGPPTRRTLRQAQVRLGAPSVESASLRSWSIAHGVTSGWAAIRPEPEARLPGLSERFALLTSTQNEDPPGGDLSVTGGVWLSSLTAKWSTAHAPDSLNSRRVRTAAYSSRIAVTGFRSIARWAGK
jgi:hypothetical protein